MDVGGPHLGVCGVVGVGGVDGLHQPVDVGAQGQVLLLRALNPSLQLKAKLFLHYCSISAASSLQDFQAGNWKGQKNSAAEKKYLTVSVH